jgi:hypothetical protein
LLAPPVSTWLPPEFEPVLLLGMAAGAQPAWAPLFALECRSVGGSNLCCCRMFKGEGSVPTWEGEGQVVRDCVSAPGAPCSCTGGGCACCCRCICCVPCATHSSAVATALAGNIDRVCAEQLLPRQREDVAGRTGGVPATGCTCWGVQGLVLAGEGHSQPPAEAAAATGWRHFCSCFRALLKAADPVICCTPLVVLPWFCAGFEHLSQEVWDLGRGPSWWPRACVYAEL